jgi:hypothetical protein
MVVMTRAGEHPNNITGHSIGDAYTRESPPPRGRRSGIQAVGPGLVAEGGQVHA